MSNNIFGKKGWTPERLGNLDGQTYLVTGANTGAGYEAAKILLWLSYVFFGGKARAIFRAVYQND